jgi:hypothetical protein
VLSVRLLLISGGVTVIVIAAIDIPPFPRPTAKQRHLYTSLPNPAAIVPVTELPKHVYLELQGLAGGVLKYDSIRTAT